jgi:hypothetical protein
MCVPSVNSYKGNTELQDNSPFIPNSRHVYQQLFCFVEVQ